MESCFYFYFILDVRTSTINAAVSAKVISLQHLFYFIADVRTA